MEEFYAIFAEHVAHLKLKVRRAQGATACGPYCAAGANGSSSSRVFPFPPCRCQASVTDKKTWAQLRKASTLISAAHPAAAATVAVPAAQHGAGESSGLGWAATAVLVVGAGALAVYAAKRHLK